MAFEISLPCSYILPKSVQAVRSALLLHASWAPWLSSVQPKESVWEEAADITLSVVPRLGAQPVIRVPIKCKPQLRRLLS